MSELQAYYDAFRTGYWATENEGECPCHGSGWALSEVDTWHKCPVHFRGQLSPEASDGLPFEALEEAYLLSRSEWAVQRGLASFTHEEAARRAPATVPAPAVPVSDDDEIPF